MSAVSMVVADAAAAPAFRKTAEMVNAMMDSTRWNRFPMRENDIIIDTWAKSGTTLTQQICAQLLFPGDPEVIGSAISPWLDMRVFPEEVAFAMLEAQTHRRFIKSHLPADCLPWRPYLKYIYIGRDVRDVIWSWHNHATGMTDEAIALALQMVPDLPPTPIPNADIRVAYHDMLAGRDWPFPFWSHIRAWWERRGEPNVLMLHFADLIGDLPGQIRKIAAFLEVPIDESRFEAMVACCQIDHVRRIADASGELNVPFKEGAKTFFNKGTNGRWRDVLTQAEIDLADQVAARELEPDCALWLKTGKL